jgi:hypothetical protein
METSVRGLTGALGPPSGGVLVTLCLMLLSSGTAGAQSGYASAPFREAPVAVAQAAALERLEVAARAFAAQPPGVVDEDDDEEAEAGGEDDEEEGGPLIDFGLFRASLAAAAPEVEQTLATAIDEMVEASEAGESAAEPANEVLELVEEARVGLLADGADSPGFRAALMASLLLDEGGVAESYEEAVEGEATAYAIGWFALQRVKALWDGLAAQATPEQAEDVGAMLTILDRLFPTELMPEQISPDPEQAEAPAQMLVGLLEGVANTDLYPGRDLAGATGLVHGIAAKGCETIQAGDGGVGLEELRIAAAYYRQTVADTLVVMAPETGEAVAERIEALDAGEAEAAAEACGPLLEALAAGQEALAP